MAGFQSVAAFDGRGEPLSVASDLSGIAASYAVVDESGKLPIYAAVQNPSVQSSGLAARVFAVILLATLCAGALVTKNKLDTEPRNLELFDLSKTKATVQTLLDSASEPPGIPPDRKFKNDPFDKKALSKKIQKAKEEEAAKANLNKPLDIPKFPKNPELTPEKRKIADDWAAYSSGKVPSKQDDQRRRYSSHRGSVVSLDGVFPPSDVVDGVPSSETASVAGGGAAKAPQQASGEEAPEKAATQDPKSSAAEEEKLKRRAERQKEREERQKAREERRLERQKAKEAKREELREQRRAERAAQRSSALLEPPEKPTMTLQESKEFCNRVDEKIAAGRPAVYPNTTPLLRFKRVVDKAKSAGTAAERGAVEAINAMTNIPADLPPDFPVGKADRVLHAQAATLRFANSIFRVMELLEGLRQELSKQSEGSVADRLLKQQYQDLLEAQAELLRHLKLESKVWVTDSTDLLQQLGTAFHSEEYKDIQTISQASGLSAIITVGRAIQNLRTRMAKEVRSKNDLHLLYEVVDVAFSEVLERVKAARTGNWPEASLPYLPQFQHMMESKKNEARSLAQKKGFNSWFVELF